MHTEGALGQTVQSGEAIEARLDSAPVTERLYAPPSQQLLAH